MSVHRRCRRFRKEKGKRMEPLKKMPLFIVTGASGVGKTTLCEELFRKETEYLVMESDIVWCEFYDTPEDNYRRFRKVWMNLCASISQIGKPVVLCGCNTPEQLEYLEERKYFTEIYYLAVVSDEKTLLQRMREGRGITSQEWLESSLHFNRWLKANADKTNPPITLLDVTGRTLLESADFLHSWIMERISG